jgi:hypothetical protein
MAQIKSTRMLSLLWLNQIPKHKPHNWTQGCCTYTHKNISQGQQTKAHCEHNKVVYKSSTQFHHDIKQWDILVIKSKHIWNYASQYTLTLTKI